MATIIEQLEQLFLEKQLPATKHELSDNIVVFDMAFSIKENHHARLEIISKNDDETSDVQMAYRYVGYLTDYDKKGEMLELINQLNAVDSGYYTIQLAEDGEIMLRTLIRVHDDLLPLYETMIQGSAVCRHIAPQLETITGVIDTVKLGF